MEQFLLIIARRGMSETAKQVEFAGLVGVSRATRRFRIDITKVYAVPHGMHLGSLNKRP